jgi:hypothetical protein
MADQPSEPGTNEAVATRSGQGSTQGMPRWVKVFLIIAIAFAAALIVSFVLGIEHGPGLHTPPGGGGH